MPHLVLQRYSCFLVSQLSDQHNLKQQMIHFIISYSPIKPLL